MNEVSVQVLDRLDGNRLKQLIEKHLNNGFYIQDSQVEWYDGTIMGVYVFVKSIEEKERTELKKF